MSRDLEEEHAVAPRVDELVCGRPAQWKPTENEGPGIVRYLLGAAVSLLAHELDRCELLQPARGDVYSSERADLNETGRKAGLKPADESLTAGRFALYSNSHFRQPFEARCEAPTVIVLSALTFVSSGAPRRIIDILKCQFWRTYCVAARSTVPKPGT